MKIGSIIKEERLKRKMTQEEIAKELFVTRQLVSKWENDRSYPNLDQVVKLSQLFDVTLEYLLIQDTKIVKKITEVDKQNKIIKLAFIVSISLIVFLLAIIGYRYWTSPVYLSKEDIHVLNVEKKILPQSVVTNSITGQDIIIPQDIEYTITFESNKPFLDSDTISGHKNVEDSETIEIIVTGNRKLFGGSPKGKIVIDSTRTENMEKPALNIDKNIFVLNYEKEGTLIQTENTLGSIQDRGDLLISKADLK